MTDRIFDLAVIRRMLDTFGGAVIERVSLFNLWTAALLAAALLLDRALASRTRASWRIALYAPVALRLFLPLDSTMGLPQARAVAWLAPPLRVAAAPIAGSTSHGPPWYALAALAYVAVAALLAGRAVRARVRLGRSLSGARAVPQLSARASCPVVEHGHLGPMVAGLVSPRIVVPRLLLDPGEEHTLACVLRHEAAHVHRGDAWLSALMQLLVIAAWPVVPMWLAVARVRRLVELACDEAAVGDTDPEGRRRYGHALLDMAERRTFTVAPVAAGELHFGSALRARIHALTSQRRWPIPAQALVLFVAPTAMLGACGSAATTSTAPGDEPKAYGYELVADSAEKAAAAERDAFPASAVRGRLPPEVIQAVVRKHFAALKSCYEAGVVGHPQLSGIVRVEYVIGEDGSTREASAGTSTLPDADVVACVVGEFRKIKYPQPEGGIVTVVYPIELGP